MVDPIELSAAGCNFKMYTHSNEVLSNQLRTNGYHSRNDLLLFNEFLKPGSYFVDVGSNIGWHSIIASLLVGNSGKVFSFEPEPNNVEIFKQNILLNNLNNVELTECAVLDKEQLIDFYLHPDNFGDHSIAESTHLRSYIKSEQQRITIPARRIDTVISPDNFLKIDLIKMDIQGCESAALAGCSELFKIKKPPIIIEYSPAHMYSAKFSPFEIFAFIDLAEYIPFKIFSDSEEKTIDDCCKMLTINDLLIETATIKDTFTAIDLLLLPKTHPMLN